MAFVLNYTKSEYQSKLTTLEGYYRQLEESLARMEELKSNMFNFWDDPRAREAGMVLQKEIQQVKNAMRRTDDLIIFYKGAIDKLDGTNNSISDVLGDALNILTGLGI